MHTYGVSGFGISLYFSSMHPILHLNSNFSNEIQNNIWFLIPKLFFNHERYLLACNLTILLRTTLTNWIEKLFSVHHLPVSHPVHYIVIQKLFLNHGWYLLACNHTMSLKNFRKLNWTSTKWIEKLFSVHSPVLGPSSPLRTYCPY